MKISNCILAASLFAVTLSCNLEDEVLVPSNLFGTWESNLFQENMEWGQVISYTFHDDGTFEYNSTVQQIFPRKELGFNSKASGIYTVDGSKVYLIETKYLSVPQNSSLFIVPLAELEEWEDWYREKEIMVTFKKRGSQMVMIEGCPINAACAPPSIFFREGNIWQSLVKMN
ncbi:hypothetical protein [Pararhodonellum marinum]|uniref:hypothetical protein n=1 Tax=Pararhodonellum marinum TaxID=2755358 RepID=UPI0018907284|nr:hypothetical protein [Pararhodonellum marinum]